MTQLLISVKNVEEALLAFSANVDVIDLKDPSVGALGALDAKETGKIIAAIDGFCTLSATVGEQHVRLNDLILDIEARAEMGIDLIKIGVSPLFYDENFLIEIAKLSIVGIKIVAVFFADEPIDFALLEKLQKAGCYGAMLDTKTKHDDLLTVQTIHVLQKFVDLCEKNHLRSGLAGSLKPQYIEFLHKINPTYIGFRGGVCENSVRKAALCKLKVIEVKNMLRMHNKLNAKAPKILGLALHS
jgi:dihydroneopterin aldolase